MNDPQYHVSFICSGNICRSPFAEGLLRKIAIDRGWGDLRVSSAGTLQIHDAPCDAITLALGIERGVNLLDHRSQGTSAKYMASCDLVLGMGRAHVETLREVFPHYASRVFLLGSYPDESLEGEQIPDPIGSDEAVFRDIHDRIEAALDPVLQALEKRFEHRE